MDVGRMPTLLDGGGLGRLVPSDKADADSVAEFKKQDKWHYQKRAFSRAAESLHELRSRVDQRGD
jgi:hypothetical protein